VLERFTQTSDLKDENSVHASAACLISPSRYCTTRIAL
jgi:hypothetical protein